MINLMESNTEESEVKIPIRTVKTVSQKKIESLLEEREQIDKLLVWLKDHSEAIDKLGIAPTIYGSKWDFDHASRDQVLAIIKAFPGTWDKYINSAVGERMDYVRRSTGNGEPTIRIWAGELPPCCKVVEEWVELPAQPATRVLKKVVKCPEPMPQTDELLTSAKEELR